MLGFLLFDFLYIYKRSFNGELTWYSQVLDNGESDERTNKKRDILEMKKIGYY